jgi:MFS family permease
MTSAKAGDASLIRRLADLPQPAWVICTGMFVNKLGNFFNVFLILYLTQKGYSTFFAGLALGAAGVGMFAGNAVGGAIADRLGRRLVIAISMFGSAAFMLLVPFCPTSYMVVLAVVIGFFAQLFRPAGSAILVDTVPPEQRVTAFGLLRLAINLGMAIGPAIGGLLSNVNYTYLFVGDAATSALFGLLVVLMLPETKPEAPAKEPEDAARPRKTDGYRRVLADRSMRLYLLAIIAVTYVYTQTTTTLPLHVRDVHLGNSFYGILLGVNALLCVAIELPLTKYTSKFHPGQVLAVGMLMTGLGVSLTGVADSRFALLGTVVVWSLGEMVYMPVATTYPGLFAQPHLRGRYQATEAIAITIAQTLAPALGGLAYAMSQTVHWSSLAVIAVIGALLSLFCRDPRKRAVPATEALATEALAAEVLGTEVLGTEVAVGDEEEEAKEGTLTPAAES